MSFRILHIADLYISESRLAELVPVISALIVAVETSVKTRPTIVAIAGNSFNSRIHLRPREMQLFHTLVCRCLDTGAHVAVMLGNNDFNQNAKSLDLVTPILETIEHKNLHSMLATGLYMVMGRIGFYVYSGTDTALPPVTPSGFSVGFCARKFAVSANFQGTYHVTLLGGEPHRFLHSNVAYAGSLIQQNINEHPLDHGYIAWEIDDLKVRGAFCRLENPLGVMYRVNIKDNIFENLGAIARVQKLQIYHYNCTREFVAATVAGFKTRFGCPVESIVDKTIYESKTPELPRLDTFATALQPDVLALHQQIVKTQSRPAMTIWRPVFMEWSGMFGYPNVRHEERLENHFNFKEASLPTFGITGENKAGKSSIFDILVYLLWNLNPRGAVLNLESKEYSGRITIQLHGTAKLPDASGNFVIDISRDSNGFSVFRDGVNVALPTVTATYKMLEALIGTYEDFEMTTYQTTNTLFTNLPVKEQSNYIMRLIGMQDIDSWTRECAVLVRQNKNFIKELGARPATIDCAPLAEYRTRLAAITLELEKYPNNPAHASKMYLAGRGRPAQPSSDTLETLVAKLVNAKKLAAQTDGALSAMVKPKVSAEQTDAKLAELKNVDLGAAGTIRDRIKELNFAEHKFTFCVTCADCSANQKIVGDAGEHRALLAQAGTLQTKRMYIEYAAYYQRLRDKAVADAEVDRLEACVNYYHQATFATAGRLYDELQNCNRLIKTYEDAAHRNEQAAAYDERHARYTAALRTLAAYTAALQEFPNVYKARVAVAIQDQLAAYLTTVCTDTVTVSPDLRVLLNNIPISACSGFQKTITNLLIRIVFSAISNWSKWPGQQIIDEGLFTSLDSKHLEMFTTNLLPFLAARGVRLLLISHQEELLSRLGRCIVVRQPLQFGTHVPKHAPKPRVFRAAEMFVRDNRFTICMLCNMRFRGYETGEHTGSSSHVKNMVGVKLI